MRSLRATEKRMPLATQTTRTITAVLSTLLLNQTFSNDLVYVFQVNCWAPAAHACGSGGV
jgi:hypothetical protein